MQLKLCEARESRPSLPYPSSREFKTSVVVRDEMSTANLKFRQEKGRAENAAMAVTVDQIAKQYGPDRYESVSTIIQMYGSRSVTSEHLSSWVHSSMLSIRWYSL